MFHGLHRGSTHSESDRLGPIGAVLGLGSGAVLGRSAWLGLGCILRSEYPRHLPMADLASRSEACVRRLSSNARVPTHIVCCVCILHSKPRECRILLRML